jgi:4-carboxymuconolactone decarboxylase
MTPPALDARTVALVQLAALVVLDAPAGAYRTTVEAAVAGGASESDVVGTLLAVAPVAGLARLVSAAPRLALALGYDVDQAWESTS